MTKPKRRVIWKRSPIDPFTTMEAELAEIHPECFAWALACCRRDRSSAEEVLQMAYVKVLEGTARYDGRSSLKTFLFGVIRNTAAERRRSSWLSARRLSAWLALAPERERDPDPELQAVRSEQAEALAQALRLLSSRQRETLQLVFAHELTIEDAAAVMGVSIGSARRHYERGKMRLRALLPREPRR